MFGNEQTDVRYRYSGRMSHKDFAKVHYFYRNLILENHLSKNRRKKYDIIFDTKNHKLTFNKQKFIVYTNVTG